eukprot:CAMPEP_0119306886 /NCGR_PEP_ID=MMETSP1333-20130426/7534_1 /TAXON_ID=418940 /ORGANISM="Scyphosphaera apsteinii, Strain RCC1455" /LENGTH=171 /DNA_ID=CAMNT_0007310313 /DNA_START=56 /DNA_END=571 /DNA_ORIENTATION=-
MTSLQNHGISDLSSPAINLVDGLQDPSLLEGCATIERKCFAKHEAMDVAAEVRKRGTCLVCALLTEGSPPVQQQQLAGYALAQRNSLALNVTKLVVAPQYRRRGIGRLLLRRCVELAHTSHAQVCSLHVDVSNEPAKLLYLAEGFAAVGERRDYYRTGRHALSMELNFNEN